MMDFELFCARSLHSNLECTKGNICDLIKCIIKQKGVIKNLKERREYTILHTDMFLDGVFVKDGVVMITIINVMWKEDVPIKTLCSESIIDIVFRLIDSEDKPSLYN